MVLAGSMCLLKNLFTSNAKPKEKWFGGIKGNIFSIVSFFVFLLRDVAPLQYCEVFCTRFVRFL